jgi:uncharacterized membrane protein YdjX (TVP38/TMEM64 family)
MAKPFPAPQRKLLLLAAAALAVLAVAGLLVLRGYDVQGGINRGVALLGTGGPWVFFIAMALLPAAGMPLLAFSLTAGRIFEQRMGMTGVVVAGLAAATVNLILTYWLARRAFRPAFARLVKRLGYAMPQLDAADQTDLIIVLRVTTGIPFFVQNYLLGLADTPFVRYLVISCVAVWTYTTGFILVGDALLQGKGHLAFIAVGILVAAIALTHFVRRHYAGKKARA